MADRYCMHNRQSAANRETVHQITSIMFIHRSKHTSLWAGNGRWTKNEGDWIVKASNKGGTSDNMQSIYIYESILMTYSSYTRGRSLIVLESQHICPDIVLESQHICPDNSASAVPRVRKKKREEDTGGEEKETIIINSSSIKTKPLSKQTHTVPLSKLTHTSIKTNTHLYQN